MSPLLSREPPVTKPARRKLFSRLFFGLLVLLSAAIGAAAGLILVYSTDLPQVEELEHYRPSSITELYDDQNRIIGSFALQRRVVASYEDYPPVLRDALISIEDKDFYQHSGINFWRIVGAAYRDIKSGGSAQGASTLTMQLARNLFSRQTSLSTAKFRKAFWQYRSSGALPSRRFLLSMQIRFFLDTELTVLKPRPNIISANPRNSSHWMKPLF